ncbi:unnamed protein product, partial [Symbiodinium natans]
VKHPQLLYEAKLLEQAAGQGFPKVYWHGREGDFNILVMERLGASLEELLALCGGRLSLRTVLLLAEQMIQRVQLLHSLGFVHRDIKAENFLIGWKSSRRMLYAIDLGLARPWRESSGAHVPYKDGKKLVGTARFSSVTSHLGVAQSRRDDVEALAYLLLYLRRGRLPWQGLGTATEEAKYERILDAKMSITPAELCKGEPAQFAAFLKYARGLGYTEEPDYAKLRGLFRSVLLQQKGVQEANMRDLAFDWEVEVPAAKALDLAKEPVTDGALANSSAPPAVKGRFKAEGHAELGEHVSGVFGYKLCLAQVQVEETHDSEHEEGRRWWCFWTILNAVSCILVIFSITTTVVLSTPRFNFIHIHGGVEIVCSAFFCFEYVLRVAAAPNLWKYVCSCLGIVDLIVAAASLPTLIIRTVELLRGRGHIPFFYPLLPLRMLRLLKLVYYLPESRQLCNAIKGVARFIMVFLLGVLVIILMLGSCLHVAENGREGFESIPAGMWWAAVTITTVGYGDAVPQTVLGKLFASLSMLIGYGMLAIPTLLGTFNVRNEDPKRKAKTEKLDMEASGLKRRTTSFGRDAPEGLVPVQIRPADCDPAGCLKHSVGFALLEEAVVQWSPPEVALSGNLQSESSREFRVSFFSASHGDGAEPPVARGSIRYGRASVRDRYVSLASPDDLHHNENSREFHYRRFWLTLNLLSIFIVVLSVVLTVVMSLPEVRASESYTQIYDVVEMLCAAFFVVEYLLRLCGSGMRRLSYACSGLGLVDLVVALSSMAAIVTRYRDLVQGGHGGNLCQPLVCLRMLRLLKLMHYIQECRQLSHALSTDFRFITVFLFGILVIVLMLGTCLYAAENGDNGFESIPHGMWWATVTLTTVGYGDLVPQTCWGKFFAACSMLIGYGLLAVPTLLGTVQATKSTFNEPPLALRSPTRTAIDLDASNNVEYFSLQPRANDVDRWRCLKPSSGQSLLDEVVHQWSRREDVSLSRWHAYHYSFTLSLPLQQLCEDSDLYVQVQACPNSDSSSDFQVIFHCGQCYSPDTLDRALAEGHVRYFLTVGFIESASSDTDDAEDEGGSCLQIIIIIAVGFFGCIDLSHRLAKSGERSENLAEFTGEALHALKHELKSSAGDLKVKLPERVDSMIDSIEVAEEKAKSLVQTFQAGGFQDSAVQTVSQAIYGKLMLMLYVASRRVKAAAASVQSMPWPAISTYMTSINGALGRLQGMAELLVPHLPANAQKVVFEFTNATSQLDGISLRMEGDLQGLRDLDALCVSFTSNVTKLAAQTMDPSAEDKVEQLMKTHRPFTLLHDEGLVELSQLLDQGAVKNFVNLTASQKAEASRVLADVTDLIERLAGKLRSIRDGTVTEIAKSAEDGVESTEPEWSFLASQVQNVGAALKNSLSQLAWLYSLLGGVMMASVLVVMSLAVAYVFSLYHRSKNGTYLDFADDLDGWKGCILRALRCVVNSFSCVAVELLLDVLAVILLVLALVFSTLAGVHLAVYSACQADPILTHNTACTQAVESFSHVLQEQDFFAGHTCERDGILMCQDVVVSSSSWPVLVAVIIPTVGALLTCCLSRQVVVERHEAQLRA